MKLLLIISLVIFTYYNWIVYFQFGILKSVSASYYEIKHKILFTLSLWGFAVPVMLYGFIALNSWWLVLAGIGICFVGAAPDYKMKMEGDVHYASAMSGIIFGLVALTFLGLWFVSLPTAVLILAINKIRNHTYWQELIAFYVIVLTLLLL